jgi:hypothetical protein
LDFSLEVVAGELEQKFLARSAGVKGVRVRDADALVPMV